MPHLELLDNGSNAIPIEQWECQDQLLLATIFGPFAPDVLPWHPQPRLPPKHGRFLRDYLPLALVLM